MGRWKDGSCSSAIHEEVLRRAEMLRESDSFDCLDFCGKVVFESPGDEKLHRDGAAITAFAAPREGDFDGLVLGHVLDEVDIAPIEADRRGNFLLQDRNDVALECQLFLCLWLHLVGRGLGVNGIFRSRGAGGSGGIGVELRRVELGRWGVEWWVWRSRRGEGPAGTDLTSFNAAEAKI